jgi:hypothetical protein
MAESPQNDLGSSAFWILVTVLFGSGLIYLGIYSLQNDLLRGAIITLVIALLVLGSWILSKGAAFSSGGWGDNALAFTAGFIPWVFIAQQQNSVLSISENGLFASISGELPASIDFIIGSFVVPIAEEMFWMFGLPVSLLALLTIASKRFPVLKNFVLQLLIITIIGALSFAFFHVAQSTFTAFIIAAIIFRTIMLVAVLGDSARNIIPFIALTPAFALGAHIGNNWGNYGFVDGLNVLFSTGFVGVAIIGILLVVFLSALNKIGENLARGGTGA